MNFVTISRDPFAREDVIRRVHHTVQDCDFCGQYRTRKGKKQPPFEYGCWPDGGKTSWDGHVFCSLACRKAYFDL
jgi:hypothetical protein